MTNARALKQTRLTVPLLASATLLLAAVPPAHATSRQHSADNSFGDGAAGPGIRTPRAAGPAAARSNAAVDVCDMTIDNPHYTSRAHSVIFKVRVRCHGGDPAVSVRIVDRLGYVGGGSKGHPAQGPAKMVASSDQTASIRTNGERATYYTPTTGSPQVRAAGTYVGYAFGEIVAPVVSNIGNVQSGYEYCSP